MPTTEARISTPNAGRYLTQLCDHLGHLQHGVAGIDATTTSAVDMVMRLARRVALTIRHRRSAASSAPTRTA